MGNGDKFIKKISKESLEGKIRWRRMFDYEKMQANSTPQLSNILIQSEFYQIDFAISYYGIIKNGILFIIYENNTSGFDGTITSGYTAYIQDEENDNKIYEVPCSLSSIYQLINSIESILASEEKEVDLFIDRYLQDNSQ